MHKGAVRESCAAPLTSCDNSGFSTIHAAHAAIGNSSVMTASVSALVLKATKKATTTATKVAG